MECMATSGFLSTASLDFPLALLARADEVIE
jgi:hypothetical protein